MINRIKRIAEDYFKQLSPFQQARLKLTAYYMAIFSVILVIFTFLTFEAKESAFVRVYTVVHDAEKGGPRTVELQDTFTDFNRRFQQRVILFDIGLWIIAAWMAYGLSGKTLKPIQEMMLEQSAFAADVSHGIRTPLTTMNMEIEAFVRTEKKLPKKGKLLFASLQEEIAYLKRITEGVLSLTRTTYNPLSEKHSPIELHQLLTKAATSFIPLAESKGQQVHVLPMKPVAIKGNEDQLKQVFTILLDNAMKYGGKGIDITVALKTRSNIAAVTIQDSGPGISTEDKRHIFSRFYRSHKTSSLARGAGLGLAVAKKIIDAHNGSIQLESKLGVGTTFTIQLPILGSS